MNAVEDVEYRRKLATLAEGLEHVERARSLAMVGACSDVPNQYLDLFVVIDELCTKGIVEVTALVEQLREFGGAR